jgi:uncharacterized protein YegL
MPENVRTWICFQIDYYIFLKQVRYIRRKNVETMASNIHLVWILDISNSMKAKGKINSLNMVIRETIPLIADLSKVYPSYNLYIRTLSFSTGAHWIDQKFRNIQEYSWNDLEAGGRSDIGDAFNKILDIWKDEKSGTTDSNTYFFVLITDGYPTDDWYGPLQNLGSNPTFIESYKIAITVPDTENEIPREFIGQKQTNKGFIVEVDDIERIPMSIVSVIEK